MRIKELNNASILIDSLPDNIFKNLLDEANNLEKNNERMISGLSSIGVPQHYYLNNNPEFYSFTQNLADKYFKNNEHHLVDERDFGNKDFKLKNTDAWFNLQKENEFIPAHTHDGLISYNVWLKIPYETNEYSGSFQFIYSNILGASRNEVLFLNKQFEGKIIMFPAKLTHIVYPFYNNKNLRISLAGNLIMDIL